MKYILPAALLLFSLNAGAQNTGIGTTSPTDQLHTTGTVRFEGYRGAGTRVVQIDSSGRMIVTGAGAISTAYPGSAIPDNGCGTGNGITSTINVTGQPTAVASSKISVRINITHPSTNDVRVILVAPGGASLLLTTQTVGGANFTNTIFTDAAQTYTYSGAALAPYTGKFKPMGTIGSLCLLNNTLATFGAIGGGSIVPNGAWTLKVYDGIPNSTGTFNSWSISFSGPESFTTAEQNNYIPRFNSGNFDASNIYQDPSTGNIGINGSNTSYPLTVNATGNGIVQSDAADGVQVGTYANSAGGWLQTYTAHPLLFATNGSGAQMTLSTAGNLGIGLAANMLARLHVLSGTASLLQLENTTALSATSTVDMAFKNGAYYTGLIRTRGTGTNVSAMGFYTFASPGLGNLYERMTILDGGNVGIGNTNPAYTLDVTGTLHSTGQALIGGALSVNGQTNVNGVLKYTGSTPGVNKVLTSDATGNAAWQYPPSYNTGFSSTVSPPQSFSGNISFSSGYTQTVPFAVGAGQTFDDGGNFSSTAYTYTVPATGTYAIQVKINGGYDVYYLGTQTANQNGSITVTLAKNNISIDGQFIAYANGDKIAVNAIIANNFHLTQGDVLKVTIQASGAVNNGIPYLDLYNVNFSGNRVY